MMVFGIILVVVGWLTGISILYTIGAILLVVGLVLMLFSFGGGAAGPEAGPGPWYHRRWY
jgi:hypothetical protein